MNSQEEFAHLLLPLEEIVEATDNFSNENLIGQGGFGMVYKGNLLLSGKPTTIAARRLHYDYGQGDLEFWNEISMLTSVKHENLVSFIGFCNERGEKIIINKHEVNGSLDKYLSSSTFTWMQRLQICVGVARALSYIHYDDGRESSVIHCNIKSSKILLHENWKPKLSGFEHSKTNTKARRHRLVLADIIGTIGYVDPTYEKTGFVTHKSDVYSFGVMLFEVLCGRRAFVPDQTEQHSPQYITEEDHKDGKLDVMGIPDEAFVPDQTDALGSRRLSFQYLGPPSFDGLDGPQSFVNQKPSSFNHAAAASSSSDALGSLLEKPSSFNHGRPPSGSDLYGNESPSANVSKPPLDNVLEMTRKSYSKKLRFMLQPLYTMKRLDQYLHTPNEELLAELAKSHYDEENLDDIIDPALRKQMNPNSFKIFSETAYNCLKDKRGQRPNIDQILKNLENALNIQMSSENLGKTVVSGEVEGRASDRWKEGRLEYLRIPLIDIEVATKNFTERYLGLGGYGKVYAAELEVPIEEKDKGEISRKWRNVAIKCIMDKRGKEGFDAEIELLTCCKHTNIVSLLGFCDEGPNMILVYEHASNRSLDNYLGSNDSSINLTWVQRLKIGIDIARGLNYLHTMVEDEKRIIHRDIKSGNILLGKNWVAKIADFGLSRFHHTNHQAETPYTKNLAGTEHYLCPEYRKTGRLKRAIDIYSFGVLLFEILSGKPAYDPIYVADDEYGIAPVVRRHFEEGTINEMVDPKIMEEVDELTSTLHKGPNQDSLKTYIEIAFRCVAITQDDRPTAKDILEELEKSLSLQVADDS